MKVRKSEKGRRSRTEDVLNSLDGENKQRGTERMGS